MSLIISPVYVKVLIWFDLENTAGYEGIVAILKKDR